VENHFREWNSDPGEDKWKTRRKKTRETVPVTTTVLW
jgi:hypothetical protein